MWMHEDLKDIVSDKAINHPAVFISMAECGQLGVFIRVMSPVFVFRASCNHCQEFYSTKSEQFKTLMDNLNYDIIQKDPQLQDKVKFSAKAIDEINTEYDNHTEEMGQFYSLSKENIVDNYKVHCKFIEQLPSMLIQKINEVIVPFDLPALVSIVINEKSLKDVRDALSTQISSQSKWFYDALDAYLADKRDLGDTEKYYLELCAYYVLKYMLEDQMKTRSNQQMSILSSNIKKILYRLNNATASIVSDEKQLYQAINIDSISPTIAKLEAMKPKLNDHYLIMQSYPQKTKDEEESKPVDLDKMIEKADKEGEGSTS